MATKNTEKLDKKRKSESMQQFKSDFENFLTETGANEELARHLKKDLSARINMPYFKEKELYGEKMSPLNVCLGFCELAISYLAISDDNENFIKVTLALLCQQQGQSFRKISPHGKKGPRYQSIPRSDLIWEHPIPVNYTKEYIYDCICRSDIEEIKNYLDFLAETPQVCMLKEGEEDKILKEYKATMPKGWNYKKDSPYDRYIKSGLDLNKLGLDNSRWE